MSATATMLVRATWRWPIIRRSAGRARSSKLTSDETGLPGSPKIGVPSSSAEGERLGRLDRDLQPVHVGDPAEDRLDHVVVAHAHAAAGDDGVVAGRGVAQHGLELGLVVGHDAAGVDDAAGGGQQRRQHGRVALPDLARAQRATVGDELVAGRQHGDPSRRVTPSRRRALTLASTPSTAGSTTVPAGTTTSPARTSSPMPRTAAPAGTTDRASRTPPIAERLAVLDHRDGVRRRPATEHRS